MTTAELRKVADQRNAIHQGQASSRPLCPDYQLIGLAGEKAFSEMFGIPMDLALKPKGDGRVDFYAPMGTVDVKTTSRPSGDLLCEAGKELATFLVLAQYSPETETARLVGWAFSFEVAARPARDFGRGVINRMISRRELRPMRELLEIHQAFTRIQK